jgi:diguanylate cyclase (GGDEF)-like protein/PAS domain S-box-containing protein
MGVNRYSQERLPPRQLVELLRELNRRRDLDSLARWFMESALKLVPQAQAARFLMLDETSGEFVHRAAVGWDLSRLAEIRIPQEVAQELCASPGSQDTAPHPGRKGLSRAVAEKLAALGIASSLPLPIHHRGQLVACFILDSRTDPNAFADHPLDLLRPFLEELSWAVGWEYERQQQAERERLFKLVWDRLADALFITTFSGEILDCNQAACRQTGYSREELLKLNIMRDLAVKEPAITYEEVNQLLARDETVVFQELKRRKDGSLYWTECAVVQATYRGRPVTISVNRDITDRKEAEERLRESEARYRWLFQGSPISLWVVDFSAIKRKLDALRARGVEDLSAYLKDHPQFVEEYVESLRVVEVNRATLRLYGADTLEELRASLAQVIPPEVLPLVVEEILAIWEGRREFAGDGVNRDLAGNLLHVRLRWSVFPGHEEDYGRVLMSIEDISDRVRAEQATRRLAQRLAGLHQAVQQLQRCRTVSEVLRTAVRVAEEVLGFELCAIDLASDQGLVPQAVSEEVAPLARVSKPGEDLAAKTLAEGRTFWGNVEDFPEAKPVSPELKSVISVPIGKLGVLQLAARRKDAFGEQDVELAEILAGHLREEIQRVQLEEKLREQAIRDPLTGLYNRRYLSETLEQELRRSKRYQHPFAIMIVDLDHFKEINDRHGHLKGDQVLREVAQLIRDTVRESDLVFRYGGDEFLIMFPETNGKAKVVAQRLRQALRRWWEKSGLGEPRLGISVGVAVWDPHTPRSLEEVLGEADAALYRAKRRKRL